MESLPVEITDVNWNNKGIMSWWVHSPTRWQLITPNTTTPFKNTEQGYMTYNTRYKLKAEGKLGTPEALLFNQ